ncbi:DUF4112 domain-containing protein [Persicimonas caeni]|uniref:DUF4112 domain-containing protein n=1 Tax=Persicimonas caeni TaxID=2292766 RepID=A0A4Y6PTA1_PERCE|nr:DUF4112 domain-containing protein [Persicimonas caeni]QDG51463.1 DUF4112 domain-containing protein [Persicimonas caeni]QED32684.1 DUF4112 domain-containing protein [Persicimonas caeni]
MTTTETTELVDVTSDERAQLERSLGRLDRLARLMDDQFELPVVRWRVGLDPIIGLIPGGGDWATWVVGVYIFWSSLRLGVPRRILTRQVINLTIDLVTGYVPALGDLFDAAFKANRRNVDLVLEFYGVNNGGDAPRLPSDLPARVTEEKQKSGVLRYLGGFVVVLVLLAIAALPFALLWWIIKG